MHQTSEIYKAVDSVITFLRYEMELQLKRLSEFDFFTSFFFPVVVSDGFFIRGANEEWRNASKGTRPHPIMNSL
jgi:hypothetical protein